MAHNAIQRACRNSLLVIIVFFFAQKDITAQVSFITFDSSIHQPGDTLAFSCLLPDYKRDSIHFATLYLQIEQIDTKHTWSYRYPIVDGISEANLIIDSSMATGNYAFHFVVRKAFFNLLGSVDDEKNVTLGYTMLTKKSESFFGKAKTDEKGRFAVRGALFEDTCYFVFTRPKPNPIALDITIQTPLDSLFVPEMATTKFVHIGMDTARFRQAVAGYLPDNDQFFKPTTTLPDVVVTAKKAKKIEQFNDQYATGGFKMQPAVVFDGLENKQISQSITLFDFLRGRVAGLQIIKRNGEDVLQWRGPNNFRGSSNVDIFVDEFITGNAANTMIRPTDVAMIKAYPPPAFLSAGGQNAAIAIYTKRGETDDNTPSRSRFKIFGYTPIEARWK